MGICFYLSSESDLSLLVKEIDQVSINLSS